MKRVLTLGLFLTMSLFVHAQVSQWTTSGANIYYNTGNVGIGNSAPTAKLTVFSTIPLGSSPMNSVLVSSIGSKAGTLNDFKSNVWLVRNSSGNDWLSARLHDGIKIDGSFTSPQVDTRTWWERDPSKDIQSWGNAANTYLTINKGSVGIGTITPSSKLQINELSDSKPNGITAATKSVLKLSRFGTPNYSYNENAEFRIGHGSTDVWGSRLDLFINGVSNITDVPDQQAMTWLYNGNVGIGTTTPNGKLDIAAPTASGKSDILQRYTWSGDLSNWGLRLEQQFNASLSSIQYNWIMRNGTSTDISVMSFAGGNVGINTTDNANWNLKNSTYKLAVNGSVIATSVTVKLNSQWPDYVFKKDYQLPPFKKLKSI